MLNPRPFILHNFKGPVCRIYWLQTATKETLSYVSPSPSKQEGKIVAVATLALKAGGHIYIKTQRFLADYI